MPADHGVGLDDDEGIGREGPDARQAKPESAVGQAEARARRRSAQGGERLAEGEVFKYQFGTGSEGGAKAGEKVEKEGEHGLAAHDAIGRSLP